MHPMNPFNPCCCCLLRLPEKDLKSLKTPNIRQGVTEIFTDMLEDCFQIQLAVNGEGWGICEECVGRLHDASDFKLQVQRSQAELRVRLEQQHVKSDLESVAASVSSAQPGPSEYAKLYETVHHCQICLAPFAQESNLITHMQTHNIDNLETQPNKACNTFEKQFSMFCSSNQYQQLKTIKRVRGPYTCRTCSEVFYSRKHLGEHQRIHKKKKEHSCEICSKKFKSKYKMMEHVRSHTGLKPYSCELCNKSFTVKSSLMKHKRIHTGDAFICDVCNKQYIRKHELVLHLKVHTGLKPYECDICNKQFTFKTQLDAHRLTHSDEKPYSCDVCGKRYKRKDHLKGHSVGHFGQKPYSCEICEQKFTAKSHVKKHKMKFHAQNV